MTKKSLLVDYSKTFPAEAVARPQQTKALEKIAEIFSSGKRFVIASLPTGSGKSHIAAAIARSTTPIDQIRKDLIQSYAIYKKDRDSGYKYEDDFLERDSFGSYILTVTKSLQDQYRSLFPDSLVAKGKSNYHCDVEPNLTVNFAPCLHSPEIKENCFATDRCPYYKARNEAFVTIDPILNYRAFFSLPKFLRKREIYICDEASDLESELVGHYSITIFYSQLAAENIDCKKLYSDDNAAAGLWLQDIYVKAKAELDKIKSRLSKVKSPIKSKEMQRLGKLTMTVNSIEEVINVWDECEYLVEERTAEKVTLVPYDIKPMARRMFDGADMILMMSATITNPEEFAKSLGISESEYGYVDIPSTFDASKSPIKSSRKYSLSYKNKNKDLPNILDIAIQICESHKGEKGIIHTHTNQITEALKKKVGDNDRFLFRELGVTNEHIMVQHKDRVEDDTILVSPSLDMGISLDDNLGRFQIIVKAPFLPLSSKRIKKIFDKNKGYYLYKMFDNLVWEMHQIRY